jgi:hypothetical protein
MPLDDISDPTPSTLRRALDVMARNGGYLSLKKLKGFSREDFGAITDCIPDYLDGMDFMPPSYAEQILANGTFDENAASEVLYCLCGWLNRQFDQESVANLWTLPQQEREAVRALPVNQKTWQQLRSRSRWHAVRPHRLDRCPSAAPRQGRHGRQTRHVRRRRVASSPRRARAPGRSADDDPEPSDLTAALLVRGAA